VSPKTFISYTRKDSEFALRIAKDLKEAGHEIWIDQLDITAGKRWDVEIEEALSHCNNLLVILSANAVISNNVLDEISYYIEEGKVIIPIIKEECKIPFRIRRVQYVNFKSNYNEGLKKP